MEGLYECIHISNYCYGTQGDEFDLITVDIMTSYSMLMYGYHFQNDVYFFCSSQNSDLQKII